MNTVGFFARIIAGAAMLVAAGWASAATTYFHNDMAGSPLAATNSSGQVVWRESYRPYGERLKLEPASVNSNIWFTGRHEDAHTELVYMGARYYDPKIGRFLSTDPVYFLESNLHSFNRYAYANNNPSKFKDPDGRFAAHVLRATYALSYRAATAAGAGHLGSRLGLGIWNAIHQESSEADGTNSAPPVPGDLVGDQSDPRAGPSSSGKRHKSGKLTPENGGTGDADKDFDELTGGTGKPFPSSDGRSKIPGARVGDNGVWIRPGTKNPNDGSRIEIPGNGDKLPETLHY